MAKDTQLVTYVDRFGQSNIHHLHHFLKEHLSDVFAGVHLLPFFYPIDGADAGYDPIDNGVVDHRLGSWADIQELSTDFDLMADMIVNHISADSPQFQDVKKNGSASEYFDLFQRKDKIFQPHEDELVEQVIQLRGVPPFTSIALDTGETYEFWTTFTENQIDIDVQSKAGIEYIKSTLKTFADNGLKYVRLDAIGFAIKKAGTTCFLLPETYEFMSTLNQYAKELGLTVLVEVHAHFNRQIEASKYVDYYYDFAMPPLVLHSFSTNDFSKLKQWIAIRPENSFNVLDTHDGIGVNDVQADWEFEGLLNDDEVSALVSCLHSNTGGSSRRASGVEAQNLDINHVNTSFYDALCCHDYCYLAARAIQLFLPGISQIYYAGFLAKKNDTALLEKTNVGRDINRPYMSFEEIKENLQKPIVQDLIALIKLRNSHLAFDGNFQLIQTDNHILELQWKNKDHFSSLFIDIQAEKLEIKYTDSNQLKTLTHGSFSTIKQ